MRWVIPLFFLWVTRLADGAVIASVSMETDGRLRYDYSVTNVGSKPIFAWTLEIDVPISERDWAPYAADVPTGIIGGEDDWEAAPGLAFERASAQDFTATSLLGGGDVLPGEMLGSFGFVSRWPVGPATYFEFHPDGSFTRGLTIGPTAIPEPSGIALLALASLLMWQRRRPIHCL